MKRFEKNSQRASNIKAFINNYNWKGTNFETEIKKCKKFEKMTKMCS